MRSSDPADSDVPYWVVPPHWLAGPSGTVRSQVTLWNTDHQSENLTFKRCFLQLLIVKTENVTCCIIWYIVNRVPYEALIFTVKILLYDANGFITFFESKMGNNSLWTTVPWCLYKLQRVQILHTKEILHKTFSSRNHQYKGNVYTDEGNLTTWIWGLPTLS